MKCPICSTEMEEGGLIVDCVNPCWIPASQFGKKGLKRLVYNDIKRIGNTNVLLGQTKIPNAFFCETCNKIVGIFDIKGSPESEG